MTESKFEELVIPLSSKLYSICIKLLSNTHEAKDCLQDVYVKLWTGKDKLMDVQNLEAYAATITRNSCIDRLRLRKQTVPIENIEQKVSTEIYPSNPVYTDERLQNFEAALKSLPVIQQQVFRLRDIECLEFIEIAEQLNLNPETTRVTLSRARRRLREFFEKNNSNNAEL